MSVGIPHKPGILAALADSNDVALWWRVVILEPGGRTLELDTPSGLDLADWQAYAERYHGPGCAVTVESRRSRDPRRVRADLR